MADWRMPVWFVARWRGDDVPNERLVDGAVGVGRCEWKRQDRDCRALPPQIMPQLPVATLVGQILFGLVSAGRSARGHKGSCSCSCILIGEDMA